MQSYRDLLVWKEAMDLVVEIFRITRRFPSNEAHGLANQMPRAAVSIPSNIAEEGGLKQTKADLTPLSIASGSLAELETQLELSRRLSYLPPEDEKVVESANEIGRMLSGLRNRLRSSIGSYIPNPKS